MPTPQPDSQVLLADNYSALMVLYAVLKDAAQAFPDAFSGTLPEVAPVVVGLSSGPDEFRDGYPDILPRFEAARLASPQRHQIACHIAAAVQKFVMLRDGRGQRPLHEGLRDSVAPLPLKMHAFAGNAGWQPNVVYRGQRWDTRDLTQLGIRLVERGVITSDASDALAWIGDHALDKGVLHLSGRKIAVLGGAAEMAPTRLWLEAGADVLWLDRQPPPGDWSESTALSGRLYWPEDNADLLVQPKEVLATLIAFADGRPLDLGLYAYAPGQARELRLSVTMNALVNALPPELIGSVTMLVSPTTPTALLPQDLAVMQQRIEARPSWEAACARLGLLGRGSGSVTVNGAAASRTVVGIQGASYQAAQYLGKVLMAECWSQHGQVTATNDLPLRVSANTAAITRTRSLNHPVFAAAFGGAAAMGVETLAPRQSRRINGLLSVRDWLHPEIPTPGLVRVHGGIHTLPYPLAPALRVAAAIGFARSPRLLRGLIAPGGKSRA